MRLFQTFDPYTFKFFASKVTWFETPEWNQVTFGAKNLKVCGSKVWNSLPFHIKISENLIQFKSLMKNWNGNSCSCIVCTK